MFLQLERPMSVELDSFTASAVQDPPVFLDLAKSLEKACTLIAQAGDDGAQLLVFPETWLSGYPIWLDVAPGAALWDHAPAKAVFRTLFNNSVEIPSASVDLLCRAAKAAGIVVVMGLHEKDGGTLYNSIITIDVDGQLVGKHRKLVPTYTERLVWGQGDGSTLQLAGTSLGPIGGLVCWEHWMPLARYAMHAQHELLHVALWPTVREMHLVASRNYAFEGQCFVIAAGTVLQRQDLSHLEHTLFEEIPGDAHRFLMRGGSAIVAPNGDCLAGPVYERPGFVTAEIFPHLATEGRLTLDVAGHYARPDVFQLHINRSPRPNVSWE
jgi:predicted amidohydrolase